MKDKDRMYGLLMVDFANAETSDEACLKLLEHMHETFDLPPDFAVKAGAVFPTLANMLKTDSTTLWEQHNDIIQSITKKLEYQFDVLNADHLEQTITIAKLINRGGGEWDPEIKKATKVPIRKFARSIGKLHNKIITRLLEVWAKMYVIEGHGYINSVRKNLRLTLEKILSKGNLHEDALFRKLLEDYNGIEKPKLSILKNGTIAELPIFQEPEYITKGSWESPRWTLLIRKSLAHALVQFILSPSNSDYIHKCKECGRYYIAKTLKRQYFCADACRMAYHNHILIETGRAAEYKRERRKKGAPENH